jgi:hypothetical protein
VVTGPGAVVLVVGVYTGAGRVRVDGDPRGDPSQGGATFTFTDPAELHASERTDFGSVWVQGLGPCDLEIGSDLGAVRLADVCGRLRLETEVGAIDVSGMAHGDLEAKTEVGAIRLTDVDGRIVVETEHGSIDGRGISGVIAARAEHGKVSLDLDRLDPGEHVVRSGWGAVDVSIPRDIEVRLDVRVDGGTARVDYQSRPEAAAVLRASTDSGSLRIREGLARGDALSRHPRVPAATRSSGPGPSTAAVGHRDDAFVREPRLMDYDADLARILTLVAAGELSARDANELLEALKQVR